MFKGAIIAHKICAVTEGQHNFIDLFCHKSVYNIQNLVKKEAGQAKPTDIRKEKNQIARKSGRKQVLKKRGKTEKTQGAGNQQKGSQGAGGGEAGRGTVGGASGGESGSRKQKQNLNDRSS
ncbi:hypothetical protein B9Z19DRAFT_1123307 [Tuber borchii]|uniref:Uncharacterized protein n=1 Tax=Tuber borchii TaxID=42251 RepID=A0A2T6ZYS2_TUBBO|nr:hypothetical protein B9Z19DRAFT_1123307 [Tuber borchii]